MKLKNKKILISLLACGMLASLTTANYINANENEELEEIQEEVEIIDTKEILDEEIEESNSIENEATSETVVDQQVVNPQTVSLSSTRAATDAAFPESSKELHDAILKKYPAIDAAPNGNDDGVISKAEAASWTGTQIDVQAQELKGTIDGIENFTNPVLLHLYLNGNQFTGSIPTDIGNMANLNFLNLSYNQFTGEIPSSIGNLIRLVDFQVHSNQLSGTIPEELGSLTRLTSLYLNNNNFSGSIPSSLGSLANLERLYMQYNQLSGEIPSSLGNLGSLKNLYLHGNNLSGTIPNEIYTLPSLIDARFRENPNLSGNPAVGFASSTTLNYLDIRGTNLIQARPNISTLAEGTGTFLNDDLASLLLTDDKTNIVDGLTQADIDKAQQNADEFAPGSEKNRWQADIDLAQSMLDTKAQVSELFGDETKTNLANITTQKSIDDAQEAVSALPDGQLKTDLQKDIDLAQSMLDATTTVNKMFNDDGTITDVVNQSVIDNAQSKVDVLPDGSLKTELQDKIDEAQRQFNEKDAKEKVENLFTDGTHTNIIDGLTQGNIDEAQKAVDKLPSGDLRDELQKEIDKAQEMLDAKNKVEDLFTDGTHTDIPDDLIQTDIDDAQKAVDKLPSGDLKDELQKEIDKAQDMLDAKNAVDDLFNDKKDNLADGVTQDDIDKAQDLVNKLPDGSLKDELQKEIDKAQDMLDAKNAANDLLDKDGNLNSGVTQKVIDKVQDLVNKLPDGELKDELQAIIDEAQKQLDEQSNPSVEPPVQKPSVNPSTSSTTGGNSVTTGDETNVSLYLGMLVSAAGLIILTKRRKEEK
ncbi:toxin Cry1Ac domain D-VI-related protein [Breznakia pachnodae]|uniref:non-specific serine/threonine protein kinase n=1 Tax=Breznakia pachnodae TaxID=265178 RepID=A0ABU0E1G1_9FIRM|nr:toxin Cry1Ac domain D-VI-related protein [Breznakia pachnodae]MDQ0360719.1 LPXTG-motif cell wall-anchored protein [Breznakia pachnodae]